jgi:aminomethyltransferase
MPVQYSGIIQEHLHTREKAGLFDICHMGEFFIDGPNALADIDLLVSCRLDNLAIGKCRYGFLLRENGTIIDDLISFRTGETSFMLVVNAATRFKDADWIKARLSADTRFDDASDRIAKIDLQGPLSADIMARLIGREKVDAIKRFAFGNVVVEGVKVLLSRTGYTGELGYELYYPADQAAVLWDRLLAFEEVLPIGLGARDTLRLEVGYPLYGHDISDATTPLESGFERFVYFEKDFVGKAALLEQKRAGIEKTLVAFECEGRRAAREHSQVLAGDQIVGEVTSGAFSPCLKRGLGLCRVEAGLAKDGQPVLLRQDKVEIPALIRDIPVYKK